MITLHEHQQEMEAEVQAQFRAGYRHVLLVGATGIGKTVIFADIAHKAAAKGKRVHILAHRIELIDQIARALAEWGVTPDIVAAGYPRGKSNVIVASIQTLIRRLDKVPPPDLIVCDEAHHVGTGNTWSKIFQHWPAAYRLGVTATPIRQDGKGLGEHFTRLISGPSVAWLIEHGYLSPPKIFAPPTIDISGLHTKMGDYVIGEVEERANKPSVTGDAITEYRKHADGKPALAFCVSVKHAEDVAAQFRQAGYQAVHLSGKTSREVRRQAVADFRAGQIHLMASCDLFSEGFDVPGVHCGILLRPTQSEGLYLQQVGRTLRTAEGKAHAVLLDHTGNTQKFGLPTDERNWALTYDEIGKKKDKQSVNVRVCGNCWAAASSRVAVCPNCGTPFEVKPRQQLIEVDGELVEISEILERRRKKRMIDSAKTLEELKVVGEQLGYKKDWAIMMYYARQDARDRHRRGQA